MRPAIPLLEAAREVEDVLSVIGLQAAIIGGLAVFRWGEPRATRDVDFTVLCPFGEERSQIAAICARLSGRIADAEEFAARHRVLLLNASNGRPVDIALGGLEFEQRAVARGTIFEFAPELRLKTCSAEDLVVMKVFAGRERDFADVSGIAVRQGARLDWPLIEGEMKPLLDVKGDSSAWNRLLKIKGDAAR